MAYKVNAQIDHYKSCDQFGSRKSSDINLILQRLKFILS